MKKTIFTTLVLISAIAGIYLTQTFLPVPSKGKITKSKSSKQKSSDYDKDRMAEKFRPAEHLFFQRAYPDATPDVEAYSAALHAVNQDIKLKSVQQGFDAEWTQQGPKNIGARINTVAVNPQDEAIMYVGFSGGGVFKTTNGGEEWTPIFDDQAFLAIGDIVLDPNDPSTVYVGTGDVNISGYTFIGDGVYKSTDAGETWTNIGLAAQRITSKIIPHPDEPNTVYVSTMGLPFIPNDEKGLYKTIDGGTTWTQSLFVNDSTGIIDMVMDPTNPDVLYAAAWTRIRSNDINISQSDKAQIWKTTDGGATWEVLINGLPTTPESRIGLAISPTNPQKIYALYVDGEDYNIEGIFKTTDSGANWENLSINGLGGALGGFGWYFGKIRVNPADDEEIYILGIDLHRLKDGETYWNQVVPPWWTYEVHADKHDLVFTPSGSIILATDGGLYQSNNDGANWTDIEDIPATQFYRTAYNPHQPDLYYGGAQDNGTTSGNTDIEDWPRLFGGDGFQMAFHPTDPNTYYFSAQLGSIHGTDSDGYIWNDLSGFIGTPHWDTPFIISAANPDLLYSGAEAVYKNTGGVFGFWEAISDDLVGEGGIRPAISTVAESSVNTDHLYAGTTNGKLWHSPDAGANWVNISAGIPERYVTSMKASPNDADRVFATISGYKSNGFIPHLHRSDDRGATWTDISSNLPQLALNDVFIHPATNDSLLIAATDGGVYATLDAGTTWERLGSNMPAIAVYDLAWNEAKNEVVAATFARSIQTFPLDSIMQIDMAVAVENTTSIAPKLEIFPNPATDYIDISFSNNEPGRTAQIAILDAQGKLVHQQSAEGWGSQSSRIDVADLAKGIYFVKIKIRHQVMSGQFVK